LLLLKGRLEAATDGDAAKQGVAQMREFDMEKERREGLIE
jgi:hypothetical protein